MLVVQEDQVGNKLYTFNGRQASARKERQRMSTSEKGTHLTLEDRKIIQKGIENGSTKTSIANTLGKDNSTIGKEITLHRTLKNKCASTPL